SEAVLRGTAGSRPPDGPDPLPAAGCAANRGGDRLAGSGEASLRILRGKMGGLVGRKHQGRRTASIVSWDSFRIDPDDRPLGQAQWSFSSSRSRSITSSVSVDLA